MRTEDEIVVSKSIKRLELTRNHERMKSTSFTQLQSWRANCDVSILLYDQDPVKIDHQEISSITNYIVTYCTKGNASYSFEKEALGSLCEFFDNIYMKCGTNVLIKKVLNKMSGARVISKAEASCLCMGLPLYKCTESFRHVAINDFVKIVQKECKTKDMNSYLQRENIRKRILIH